MGEAILTGLLAAGTAPQSVVVTVRRSERAEELALRHGVTAIASNEEERANADAVTGADVVILGVKPVGIAALCREIAADLAPNAVVISVAAAVSLAQMEAVLKPGQPVVRSMPNTPLTVGRGVVALSAGTNATAEHLEAAHQVFDGSGIVLDIPEDQQDAVSAISGSGPAYAFYLAEAMAAAAVEFGLSADIARILARETVAGSAPGHAAPRRHQPERHHRAGHRHVRRPGVAGHCRRRCEGRCRPRRRDHGRARREITRYHFWPYFPEPGIT